MYFQLVNTTSQNVFKKYSRTYNVFRDLYEVGSFGLEISNIDCEKADAINKLFLTNGDFSYIKNIDNNLSNLLSIGSIHKLKENANMVKSRINEEIGHRMIKTISNYENYDSKEVTIGERVFKNSDVHIMGVLNVTPDSFSDGGQYYLHDKAVQHALNMIDAGADIIDVGGESTRPDAEIVEESEELERVIPVIEKLHDLRPDVIISADTSKSKVADAAVKAGAALVNDISGGTFDDEMFSTVAANKAAIVLMHIKGTPRNMQLNPHYDDVLNEIHKNLLDKIGFARSFEIENIIIDPGFGFGKELHHNFEILERLDELKSLGYPIMAGVSRKSMLGKSLNLDVKNRDAATIIAETIAVNNGARFIRTHNVYNAHQLKKVYRFVNNPDELQNV